MQRHVERRLRAEIKVERISEGSTRTDKLIFFDEMATVTCRAGLGWVIIDKAEFRIPWCRLRTFPSGRRNRN